MENSRIIKVERVETARSWKCHCTLCSYRYVYYVIFLLTSLVFVLLFLFLFLLLLFYSSVSLFYNIYHLLSVMMLMSSFLSSLIFLSFYFLLFFYISYSCISYCSVVSVDILILLALCAWARFGSFLFFLCVSFLFLYTVFFLQPKIHKMHKTTILKSFFNNSVFMDIFFFLIKRKKIRTLVLMYSR